jgi:sulfur-carrier protein
VPTVTVKLFATLQKFLPAGTKGRQAAIEIGEGTTVADLLRQLAIPHTSAHAIMVNGEHREPDATLSEGDSVTIFPPVAGG